MGYAAKLRSALSRLSSGWRRRVLAAVALLVLLWAAPNVYMRWLGARFPADTTPEGAYLRIVLAVTEGKLDRAFAYLETDAQWACHTLYDYETRGLALARASYPEPERARLLTAYHLADGARDAAELFGREAAARGWDARLRRDMSGVGRVEINGERATIETARGTRYTFRKRENGIWGLTMFTGELRAEAERAARDYALIEKAAADYRAAAGEH